MSVKRPIKYEHLGVRHSHHYGEGVKVNVVVYFEGVLARNRAEDRNSSEPKYDRKAIIQVQLPQ